MNIFPKIFLYNLINLDKLLLHLIGETTYKNKPLSFWPPRFVQFSHPVTAVVNEVGNFKSEETFKPNCVFQTQQRKGKCVYCLGEDHMPAKCTVLAFPLESLKKC